MKFRPKVDRLFWIIFIPIELILVAMLIFGVLLGDVDGMALALFLAVFIFTEYWFVSPFFGYAELREDELFIKYGFILKRCIPYSKIREVKKIRRWYSESMLSLKMAMDHIDIKYNSFDVTSLSLKDEDAFIEKLNEKTKNLHTEGF